MSNNDIQIGSGKSSTSSVSSQSSVGGSSAANQSSGGQQLEATDYLVRGVGVGQELLDRIKEIKAAERDQVIYGVYNNSDKSFFTRVNDFLIDHSSVSVKDKSYFFHMLAVMVDAGIPVVQALKSLASHTENLRFRRVLNTVAHDCEGGMNLADSMSRFSDVFSESEIGIIKAGEATGRLNATLFKLSVQTEKSHELSMKLWSAAIYPLAVLSVLILVGIAMLLWVFPTLLSTLGEAGVTGEALPFATRALIWLQGVVVNFWWLVLLLIFLAYGFFNLYVSTEYGAVRWDYLKLKFPIIGSLVRKVYVLNFVSLLGLLIESGLPVIKSLQITGNSVTNKIYKLKAQEIINRVKKGEKISHSMEDSEFIFPGEVVQMLRVGESSANLAKVSEKVADQYQREVDNTLKRMTSLFEPLMILVVGLLVALMAVAIMAPIFNLSSVAGV